MFLAGHRLGVLSFGWPLLIAGSIKIAYDLLLLSRVANVRPPDEPGAHESVSIDAGLKTQ